MKTTLEKSIKEIVQQASEYLPEDIEFGLVRELEKREAAAVNAKLQEAEDEIRRLKRQIEYYENRNHSLKH